MLRTRANTATLEIFSKVYCVTCDSFLAHGIPRDRRKLYRTVARLTSDRTVSLMDNSESQFICGCSFCIIACTECGTSVGIFIAKTCGRCKSISGTLIFENQDLINVVYSNHDKSAGDPVLR